jgi:prepilin-type N-terminal cleavage/methylation domain-containing protein
LDLPCTAAASWPGCPARRTPARASRAGFSLPELMTVIVIIGIMAVLAAPRLDTVGRRTDAGMHQVAGVMAAAQRAAVARQHDVVVSFDAAVPSVITHFDKNGDGLVTSGERVLTERLSTALRFDRGGAPAHIVGTAGLTFEGRQSGRPAVIFRRGGSASEEGGAYVTSRRATGAARPKDTRLVVVDRATGRVATYSYEGGAWKSVP